MMTNDTSSEPEIQAWRSRLKIGQGEPEKQELRNEVKEICRRQLSRFRMECRGQSSWCLVMGGIVGTFSYPFPRSLKNNRTEN